MGKKKKKIQRIKKIKKGNVGDCVIQVGCAVIILVIVALFLIIGYRTYQEYYKPSDDSESNQLIYRADSISKKDSVMKEVPKEEPKVTLPVSSSSRNSSYQPSDNMRGFDPRSEDDMDDNGMSRYMNAYDDEDWY